MQMVDMVVAGEGSRGEEAKYPKDLVKWANKIQKKPKKYNSKEVSSFVYQMIESQRYSNQ
jgi:hypothetical protein